MAKTITFVPYLDINDTALTQLRYLLQGKSFSDTFTGAMTAGNPGLVEIGLVEEAIDFGDVVPGLVMLWNTDATNYVDFGCTGSAGTGGDIADFGFRLRPQGMPAIVWLKSTYEIRMIANTAACKVLVLGFNA
jgi:hypothetical protein